MTSQYNIITIDQLNDFIDFDLTLQDSADNYVFPTSNIESWISRAEEIAFALVNKADDPYNSSNCPTIVKTAVYLLAEVLTLRRLKRSGFLENYEIPSFRETMQDVKELTAIYRENNRYEDVQSAEYYYYKNRSDF